MIRIQIMELLMMGRSQVDGWEVKLMIQLRLPKDNLIHLLKGVRLEEEGLNLEWKQVPPMNIIEDRKE